MLNVEAVHSNDPSRHSVDRTVDARQDRHYPTGGIRDGAVDKGLMLGLDPWQHVQHGLRNRTGDRKGILARREPFIVGDVPAE